MSSLVALAREAAARERTERRDCRTPGCARSGGRGFRPDSQTCARAAAVPVRSADAENEILDLNFFPEIRMAGKIGELARLRQRRP